MTWKKNMDIYVDININHKIKKIILPNWIPSWLPRPLLRRWHPLEQDVFRWETLQNRWGKTFFWQIRKLFPKLWKLVWKTLACRSRIQFFDNKKCIFLVWSNQSGVWITQTCIFFLCGKLKHITRCCIRILLLQNLQTCSSFVSRTDPLHKPWSSCCHRLTICHRLIQQPGKRNDRMLKLNHLTKKGFKVL